MRSNLPEIPNLWISLSARSSVSRLIELSMLLLLKDQSVYFLVMLTTGFILYSINLYGFCRSKEPVLSLSTIINNLYQNYLKNYQDLNLIMRVLEKPNSL